LASQEERDRLVVIETKQKFFEQTIVENINRDTAQLHEIIMQQNKDITELRLLYSKHAAVQTSWQRFIVPIISSSVSAGLVAVVTFLLVGGV